MGRRRNKLKSVAQPRSRTGALQRTAKRSPPPQSASAAPRPSRLLIGGAIFTSLALLITVILLLQNGTSQSDSTQASQTAEASLGSRSATAETSSTVEQAGQQLDPAFSFLAKNDANQQADPIELTREPTFGDTETEQQRLLAVVEQAVESFPRDARVQYIAALTYAELLQTQRASELYNRSLELDDRQTDVSVAYARLLLSLGQQSEAIEVLTPVVGLEAETDLTSDSSNGEALCVLGQAYSQHGDLDRAVQTLQRGVALFADDGELHLQLAKCQNQAQRFAAAEEQARRAIELGVTDRAAYVALSTALIRGGKQQEALDIRAQLSSMAAEPKTEDSERYRETFRMFASSTYAMLGQAYLSLQSETEAEKTLRDALRLDPTSVKALVALGDLCYRAGRTDETLAIYQRLIEIQPENLVNYSNCASLAIAQRNLPLAEKVLRQAVERDERGYANLFYARVLMELGRFDDAAEQAETAAQRSAEVDAYLIWIAALQQQGKTAQALEAWMQARKSAPNDKRLANVKLW